MTVEHLLGLQARKNLIDNLPPHRKARTLISDGIVVCSQGHGTDFSWRTIIDCDSSLGTITEPNGTIKFRVRCNECASESADMPTQTGHNLLQAGAEISWNRTATRNYPPCSYTGCTTPITEYHHFAPRNTFGDDADNWPVMPLCRKHHQQWHQQMDGYRWHARRTA